MTRPQIIDPSKMPFAFANGPMSVTGSGDLVIISFTQITPRIEGQALGALNVTEYDFRVVARVAIPRASIGELPKVLQGFISANAPTAGSA